MATGPGVNQGKGKFVRGFLPGNRDASVEAVTAAWNAEGHDDGISESLISKIRSELGLTGRKRAAGGATEAVAGSAAKGKAKPSPKKPKGASKAVEVPSQPTGRESGTGPGKMAFVEEVLGRNPKANVKAINGAWAAAGNQGTISDSVIYKVKRERGVTSESTAAAPVEPEVNRRPRGRKPDRRPRRPWKHVPNLTGCLPPRPPWAGPRRLSGSGCSTGWRTASTT